MKLLTPSFQERILFDYFLNGVCFLNTDKQITYWNDAAERFLGFRADEVMGEHCVRRIVGESADFQAFCGTGCSLLVDSPLVATIRNFTTSLRHKDGHWVPLELSCFPLLDIEGGVVGSALIFSNIRSCDDLESRLTELTQIAYYDALTNIPNRRYLEGRLEDAIRLWTEEGHSFVGVLGDIDFFKSVNDTHGHDVGDHVLKEVASVLTRNTRTSDVVGRWGGEEFLILLDNFLSESLVARLNYLREAIASNLIQVEEVAIRVTMSFGATEPRKGETAASLLSRMDDCLYRSKREGRNRVTFEPA